MESSNFVKLGLNSSSEVLEINYKWNIPNFRIKHIYSEKLKLKDDIECTIMLVPKLEEKHVAHKYNKKEFVRSCFTVFFTKVPDNESTFFSLEVREHYKQRPVYTAGFRKVTMSTKGFTAYKNNLNSAVLMLYIEKDHSINLDVKFIVDDFSFKSFNLKNFNMNRSQLSQDFALLYDNAKFTDLMIICANNEDEVVLANKALLAFRSPIFGKMLNREASRCVLKVDFRKEVVVEFLRFLYTDSISLNEFDVNNTELLEMAEKYEVKELANLCKQDLIYGCKNKLDEIYNKFRDLSSQNISELENIAYMSRCVKDLYKAIKNLN